MRRALEGAGAPEVLSEDAVNDLTADAIAEVILYTGGVFGKQLLVTGDDQGVPDEYATNEALTLREQAVIATQAALNYFFQKFSAMKTTERIADEAQTWEYTLSANLLNEQLKLLIGERDRALQALRFFFNDRRPAGWRQWAEVVLRDIREPRFLGDMPHGWVASDHIRSVLDLFAYEHEGDRSLVLAAGVPLAWLQGEGVAIDGLRTPYGPLSWSVRTSIEGIARVATFELQPLREMPPGGIWLRGPWPAEARVQIDGQPVDGSADAIRLPKAPAKVRIEWLASETG